MEAFLVYCQVYSDRLGPMNDVIYDVSQLVIERGRSLVVITPFEEKVSVSLVKKDYLKEVKVLKKVKVPDDLVEKALQMMALQNQLTEQLQKLEIENEALSSEIEDLDIKSIFFKLVDKHKLK